jgi:tetratricopeptide (TPR) repeat protein
LEVGTKNLLGTANSRGDNPDSILKNQVDDLSGQIAKGVGLSQRKYAATAKPIGDLTTNSQEAYRYYLMGMEDSARNRPDFRIGFEIAAKLDPNFAMALMRLGGESLKKAMSLSNNVSEKEKLYIEARYASVIEQDRGKAASIYRQIVNKFPKEKLAFFSLASLASGSANLLEAIAMFKKAIEIDPYYVMAWTQMGYLYFDLDEPEKGLDAFKQAVSARPDYAQARGPSSGTGLLSFDAFPKLRSRP